MPEQMILYTIFIFVFLLLLLFFLKRRSESENQNQQTVSHLSTTDSSDSGKYPKGHFMSKGISIGMPFGFLFTIPYGIIMDNMSIGIALGPSIGVAIGVGIGAYLENKNKDHIRKMTPEEKLNKIKFKTVIFGILTFFLVLGLIALFLFGAS